MKLTEKMCQKTDLFFHKILKRVLDRRLDSQDIRALNQRLAIELSILGALNIVIII